MFILGSRQPQPKHLLTAPGPAGTASTHGHHRDAKGQEQIHGDLSLRPYSPVATASARGRRWDRSSWQHLVQLLSGAAPKAETAWGPAACSQFSHLHLSQHLSNNELIMPKASSLTKYYFPLHPAEAEARWLGKSSGTKGLYPAMATGPCSLLGIHRDEVHPWGKVHPSLVHKGHQPWTHCRAALPHTGDSANHIILLWAHSSLLSHSIKLHWGKGSTFSNPVPCLNHPCRVNYMKRLPEKPASDTGSWKGGGIKGAPCPALGIRAVIKEAVGWAHIFTTPRSCFYPQVSAMTENQPSNAACSGQDMSLGTVQLFKPLSKNAGRLEVNLQLVLLLKPEKVVYLQNMYSYLKTANWDLLHLCRDPLPGIKKHHPSNKQNILKAEGKSLGIRQQLHSCWSIGHSPGSGTDFSLMDQYFLNVSMPTPPSFTLHTAPHCSCALLWTIPFGHL